METGKRVEMLESELKLMKGEVKETLSSVRDFLQRAKVPSHDTILIPTSDDESHGPMVMPGKVEVSGGEPFQASPGAASVSPASAASAPPPQAGVVGGGAGIAPQAQPAAVSSGAFMTQAAAGQTGESPENMEPAATVVAAPPPRRNETPEPPRGHDPVSPPEEISGGEAQARAESGPPTPQVNLLANLIRWVASARGEIGGEQLATFLEVYGITGNLSQELKEVILQLMEITSAQPQDTGMADVWSRLLLELHGILAGGGAPLHPAASLGGEIAGDEETEEPAEEEKPRYRPLKLKLVVPQGDGMEKEFTIDIDPDAEEPGPAEKAKKAAKNRGEAG